MARPESSRLAVLIALLLLLGIGLSSHPPTARADPFVTELGNGNKTATWDFANPTASNLSGVEIGPGGLALEQLHSSWVQTSDTDFTSNGTVDDQATIESDSLRLRGNEGSLLANGDFSSSANWTFTNSPSGTVLASLGTGTGEFTHSTPDSSSQFDSMDAITTSWTSAASPGASSLLTQETVVVVEGSGSARTMLTLTSSTGWAGVQKTTLSPWNFQPYNEFSVRLSTTYQGPGQLSAVLNLWTGTAEWNSTPVPMTTSWQVAVFDISLFGNNLSSINRIQFRFTGVGVLDEVVYIDDVWHRYLKSKDEFATIQQSFFKSTLNPGTTGSAILSLDDYATSVSNVAETELRVVVLHETGPGTSWSTVINSATRWTTRSIDVSSAMAGPGTYTISISLRVRIATHLATSAALRIDNVVLLSPDYADGVYVSNSLSAESPAIWTLVSWTEAIDTQTDVLVDLRSGATPSFQDSTWSEWTTYTNASGEPVLTPSNSYLQFRIRLETSDSSRSPSLLGLTINYARYRANGIVETQPFTPSENLIRWRWFNASAVVPASTSLTFEISANTGVSWQVVTPGADLRALSGASVRIRASLISPDTSQSPQISSISVTYEYQGMLDTIKLCVSGSEGPCPVSTWNMRAGDTVEFTALGYDAWVHPVAFTPIWETNEPGGNVTGGLYGPHSAGTWIVRARASDSSVRGEITVVVELGAPPGPTLLTQIGWPWSAIGIAAAVAAVVVWEVFFRYPHTLEDVFVIARDGRLVVHKTRRLRADRDEDIFAGMLTAITAFVRDSFKEEKRELDHFGFGDRTVYVERGEFGCVAAIYSGTAPPWVRKGLAAFVADLDRAHGNMIQSWSGDGDDVSGIRSMTEAFVERRRYAPPWRQSRTSRVS